jgi:hypothetical protein
LRSYGKVSPRFWTGPTGKAIRALGADAQVVALYLMTAPSSSMTGLYYLPIPVLVHETGSPFEGASKVLRSLREVGFCDYDEVEEVVWVPEMAHHQVGDSIKAKDKRAAGVVASLEPYRNSRFYGEFFKRYGRAYGISDKGPSKPHRSPLEGPSKVPRSQDQEQEQEQEQSESQPAPTGDAYRKLADLIWAEQEDARKALIESGIGKGTRGLGLVHPAKSELVRRIAEQATGRSLDDAAADCRHVLAVLVAEARVTKSVTWLNGLHWKAERFAAALAREVGSTFGKKPDPGSGPAYASDPYRLLETA